MLKATPFPCEHKALVHGFVSKMKPIYLQQIDVNLAQTSDPKGTRCKGKIQQIN